MKKKVYVVYVLSLGVVLNCYSNNIEWGVARWEYDTGYFDNGDYMLDIVTSLPWYPPFSPTQSLGFRTQVSTSVNQGVFQDFRFSWASTPYSCAFLPVSYGTLIDNALYANAIDDWLPYDDGDDWPHWVEPYAVNGLVVPKTMDDLSNTIFVAFALYSLVFDGYMIDYYGWLEFGYDGTNIYLVNSAMETTGQGIYAGTGIVIPEPSTVLLAIVGLAVLGLRRRKVT